MVLSNFINSHSIVFFSICDTKKIRNIGNKSIEEDPSTEGDEIKPLSTGVEDISIGDGVATHIESGGVDILAQDSKVVDHDDKINEGKVGIMPSQKIKVQEGLNLLEKQEKIHIVSNNNIDISPGFLFLIFLFQSYIFISLFQTFYSFCRYSYKIGNI